MPSIAGSLISHGITDTITAMAVCPTGHFIYGTSLGDLYVATDKLSLATLEASAGSPINAISVVYDPVYGNMHLLAAGDGGVLVKGLYDYTATFAFSVGSVSPAEKVITAFPLGVDPTTFAGIFLCLTASGRMATINDGIQVSSTDAVTSYPGFSRNIYAAHADATYGFLVGGASGYLLRSLNGEDWYPVTNLPSALNTHQITSVSTDSGVWAVGTLTGYVAVSTDEGASWAYSRPLASAVAGIITLGTSFVAYGVGGVKHTDDMITWTPLSMPSTNTPVELYDHFAGGAGFVMIGRASSGTTARLRVLGWDGGSTWSDLSDIACPNLSSASCSETLSVAFASADTYVSLDNSTWEHFPLAVPTNQIKVFVTGGAAYTLSRSDIWRSTDGQSWAIVGSFTTGAAGAIAAIGSGSLVAFPNNFASTNAPALKCTDGGLTWQSGGVTTYGNDVSILGGVFNPITLEVTAVGVAFSSVQALYTTVGSYEANPLTFKALPESAVLLTAVGFNPVSGSTLGDGTYVLVGEGDAVVTSTDRNTWVTGVLPMYLSLPKVHCKNGIVVIGDSVGTLLASTDVTLWTVANPPFTTSIRTLAG